LQSSRQGLGQEAVAIVAKPVIALNDVSLTLSSRAGPVEILKRVNLEIGAGESVAVVGPSGSGKTSLLMIVAGLERATSGLVRVAGRDFLGLSEDELAIVRGSNIGIVFQSFHLVPTMTALENVALPLEFAGKPSAFATARTLLVEVGLAHRLDGKTGEQVVELLFELQRRRGATLVFVTHDVRLAQRCGRLVRMADGEIAGAELATA